MLLYFLPFDKNATQSRAYDFQSQSIITKISSSKQSMNTAHEDPMVLDEDEIGPQVVKVHNYSQSSPPKMIPIHEHSR